VSRPRLNHDALDERLAAHAATLAASFCADRHADDFCFEAEWLCLALLRDPEGWGWLIGRDGDGRLRVITHAAVYHRKAGEALFHGWCAFAELVRAANAGEPPDLTEGRDDLKATRLLTNAFGTLALELTPEGGKPT
jgi:hypothetical protein